MKKKTLNLIASAAICLALASCGGATTANTTSNQQSMEGALIGALVQGATGNNTQTSQALSTAVNAGTLISGLIGQLTNSSATATSIVGTWTYVEPTIQFESENLLAKAGGSMASQAIINKVEPYYKKVGITKGTLTYTFNSDKTCTYSIKGKTFQGTYVFNPSANTLSITSALGINVLKAYVTVSANNMAVTFDTSKLLTFLQNTASVTSNTTISTLSTLSKSFNGMKTGFLFKKK